VKRDAVACSDGGAGGEGSSGGFGGGEATIEKGGLE
jgi:hypothetical protein